MTGWWATVGTAIAVLVLVVFLLAAVAVTVDAVCRDRLPTRHRRSAVPEDRWDYPECGAQPSTPSPGWRPCRWRPLTWGDVPLLAAAFREPHDQLDHKLDQIIRKLNRLDRKMSAQQDAIDQLDALVVQENGDLQVAVAGIQAELAALQAAVDAGQPVDLTAISEHVASLRGSVDSAAALVPAAAPPVGG